MGWERRGSKRYYYRARRVGTRVIKEYFGSGRRARLAAKEDDEERRRKALDRCEIWAIEKAVADVETLMGDLEDVANTMLQASLLAAGYHQHRGNWRKSRARDSE
jgi:hypothetical protein